MNKRYAALLTLLMIANASGDARADVAPPNACTMPGQPCMNACSLPPLCRPDAALSGICTPSTCTRTGPIYLDAGPDSDGGDAGPYWDGGVIIGPISYPCNLCFPGTIDADAGDAGDAPDQVADAIGDDANGENEAGEAGGRSGAAGTGGAGGSAGSSGTGGADNDGGGASGTGGSAGTSGVGGGGGTGPSDSGCSCILDADRSETSRTWSAGIALVGIGGYFWRRRRSGNTPKKDRRPQ